MRLTKGNLGRLVLPAGKSETIVFDDDIPGFGLRIRAGGKRTWIAQYRLGTKQRRVTLGTPETVDAEQARQLARTTLARVSLGEDPQSIKVQAKAQAAVTLGAVVPRYLAHVEGRQRPGHHDDVRRYFDRHWAPLAGFALASIDRARVAARLSEMARDNGPIAANRARAALSAFYTWAIGEGIAHDNPVMGTNKPAEEVVRDRVLSDAEVALIWRHAGVGDFGVIVRLLLLTACRREEVGGMAWSELQGATWTIPAERTKNGRAHELMLPPAAMAVLTAQPARDGRDLVFGSRAGPFSGWSKAKAELDARMLAALKAERGTKAVLEPWRLHDLRRTAATRMGDLGVQPHVVEAVLNHVSGSKAGIAGIYNRAAYRDEKRAALALWADRVTGLTGGEHG
ncbi:tyrosine-type recombinase/integrase [Lichenibacterium ramalinae]|uniref:Site-specific integrase n=1 Tax=Lichenibacterium ramalinae TaxID=2316527 RepID=A0A4Q2R4P5_9HYPH|nr:site-specific integrase [Lichenibacterium ramalinae]RYB01516.1 site-specific integrase [Lichenibacterium ramalinae]